MNQEYAFEPNFERRKSAYVFRSIWDDIVWRSVVEKISSFERTSCLYGTVLYSSNATGLPKLIVTSEVLARLAERGCTFSAYRISKNWYLLDQINHRRANIVIK